MQRYGLICLMALVMALFCWPGLAGALPSKFSGQVIGVADGDTLTVLFENQPQRIRLYGIDCPERKQDFGTKAKQFTAEFAFNKTAQVQVRATDAYHRTVASVAVEGKSLNEALVEAGLAWWYRRYAPGDKRLEGLEQQARQAKRGLWSHPNPIAPWQFRHPSRGAKAKVAPKTKNKTPNNTSLDLPVKLSRSGLCHTWRSRYYSRTQRYTPYPTLKACLKAGGREPL